MRNRYIQQLLGLLLLLIIHTSLQALNAPILHCAQVEMDGSVKITWTHPTDMTGFSKYNIYYSANGTDFTFFTDVTNNPPDVNSANHRTINANDGNRHYYRVDAVSATGTVYPSNVIHTMEFFLINPGNGLAALSWAPPTDPLLPSWSSAYDVYRKYPWNTSPINDGFVFIGATSNLTYVDTITVCDMDVYYRVELSDNVGVCRNVSRSQNDVFSDLTQPNEPTLDSVSVDFETNTICLGWRVPVGSSDVVTYIIYYQDDNGMWVPIDTVFGYNNTYWEDTERDPSSLYRYRIAALDSCDNPSTITQPQNFIQLSGILDVCPKKAYLTWNAYENMPGGVGKYQIFYSRDGGALQYAGEVNAPMTSYTLTDLMPNSNYKVIVRAVNTTGNITSSSVPYQFIFEASETDDFCYLRTVSVVDNQYMEIKVLTSGDTLPFSSINLYKSIGNSTDFFLMTSLPYNGSAVYSFEDQDVNVNSNVYYYKVEIINECDAVLAVSNISHNIMLFGEGNDAKINNLQWVAYGTWEDGVASYSVYRKLQTDTIFVKIEDLIAENAMYYSDDVSELFEFGSDFIYYVVAIPHPNPYNLPSDESVSNQIVARQKPTTYIPNAFNPAREYNRTFKPINSFVDTQNYLFTIWARNGQIVFQTRDPYLGWDGTYNGKNAPMGVYIYHVKYLYPDGSPFETKGTVTLVR